MGGDGVDDVKKVKWSRRDYVMRIKESEWRRERKRSFGDHNRIVKILVQTLFDLCIGSCTQILSSRLGSIDILLDKSCFHKLSIWHTNQNHMYNI